MKRYTVWGVILAVLGDFGTLVYSSIFFSFITLGVFLAVYYFLGEKRGEAVSEVTTSVPQSPLTLSFPKFYPN
ncbi:hypothetical protein DRO66_00710 [Candidatus Bathyarchaeota archaeon]|nr:MAG: hypothetical protein DRO66_00710 [Candidatus Bathyarchaeota archaeon]